MSKYPFMMYCRFPPPFTGETIGTQAVHEYLAEVEALALERMSSIPLRTETFAPGQLRWSAVLELLWSIRQILRLRSRLREKSVLYIVPGPSMIGHLRDIFMVLLMRGDVSIVCHVRSGNFVEVLHKPVFQFLSNLFVKRVDRFVFLSPGLAARAGDWIPSDKISVVFNCIDQDVVPSAAQLEEKRDRQRCTTGLRVLYLSNMYREKGVMDLLAAIAQSELSDITVSLVGAWPDAALKREVESLIRSADLESKVSVLGPVAERDKVRMLYLEHDVFVLPTYYPVEAQPRSIIEAFAAANPVIATHHASIPEYVKDGENGFLVDTRSPDQIGEALVRLQDSDLLLEMGGRALQTYRETFSKEAFQGKFMSIIEQIA